MGVIDDSQVDIIRKSDACFFIAGAPDDGKSDNFCLHAEGERTELASLFVIALQQIPGYRDVHLVAFLSFLEKDEPALYEILVSTLEKYFAGTDKLKNDLFG